ncbi:MAG: PAS domain S-box protein [Nitrospirota bacterium]
MKDERKTKQQLIQEILELRLSNTEFATRESLRNQKENVKKSTREMFRDLVENANDLIHVLTPDGRFLYVNKAWLYALGYQRREINHLSMRDIIHPDSLVHCRDIFGQLLSGKKLPKFETELVTRSAKKIVVEVSSRCKFINGKPVYIHCNLQDVTQRKDAEQKLEDSERKYLDFYQKAPAGYYFTDSGGLIIEVNDTWLNMLGYSRSEVEKKMNLRDILSEEGWRRFSDRYSEFLEKGTIENLELDLRKKDGSYIPVLQSATAVCDKKGNFMQSRSIIRDISARVKYRKMLEQALNEWRVTFDSMPYGVLLLDDAFGIRRANKYFFLHFNILPEEIKSGKSYEIIKSEQLKDIFDNIRQEKSFTLDAFEYCEERLNKHFLLYLTPLPDDEGLTRSFVLAIVDISEIRDKQKKLTESRDAFFNMLKEVDFSYRELKGLYEGLIHSFVNAIDAKSPWTKGHSERVTKYAVAIAEEMSLEKEDIEMLRVAGLFHDIGKIGTYDIILDNPNVLSDEESRLINLHPIKGEEILAPIKQLQHLLPVIRHHHERVDGEGYPDGLKADEIPVLARILCVADAFDSMVSDRPYRAGGTPEYAISELKRCMNTQFDADVVEAFLSVLSKENAEVLSGSSPISLL